MSTHVIAAASLVALTALAGSAQQGPDAAKGILSSIDAKKDQYASVAKHIWDDPELGFQEERSSALLQKTLADTGFTVERGVGGMPTAFSASYGSGTPVLAIIGEFDALPGLSQAAGDVARNPLKAGAPGHGCGHNLLGTASAAAAIAVKEWMIQTRQPGILRYYVIKHGGVASNIVPDYAEAEYQARHPDMRVLQGIWDRILKAAEGAALGTGTRVEHEVITSYWNVLPNETLAAVQHRNLTIVGGVDYTPEEQAFAEKIRATLISPATPMGAQKGIQPMKVGLIGSASTDMGDISWNVPAVQMTAATFTPGVPAHSWQAVACAGTSIGVKGMMVAAKTMALTLSDLFKDPATIAKAKEEFLHKRGGAEFKYTSIVGGRKPPLDYRKE